jgi:hypothetical protein
VPGYDLELIAAAPCQSIRYSSLVALDRGTNAIAVASDKFRLGLTLQAERG